MIETILIDLRKKLAVIRDERTNRAEGFAEDGLYLKATKMSCEAAGIQVAMHEVSAAIDMIKLTKDAKGCG